MRVEFCDPGMSGCESSPVVIPFMTCHNRGRRQAQHGWVDVLPRDELLPTLSATVRCVIVVCIFAARLYGF